MLVSRFVVLLLLLLVASGGCAPSGEQVRGRAIMLVQKRNYDRARAELEKYLSSRPEDIESQRLLIRVSALQGDLGAAERFAHELSRQLSTRSPIPWIELGHAFELAHRYEEALELYDRAADVAPQDEAGPRAGGLRSARWGEWELSEPRLIEALRRNPANADTWHALGFVRAQRNHLLGARAAYRSGLAADEHSLVNRLGLATVALALDEPEAALAQYEAIVRDRPEFADAHLGRSWALIRLGRLREAEQALAVGYRLGANRETAKRQRDVLQRLRGGGVATRNQ